MTKFNKYWIIVNSILLVLFIIAFGILFKMGCALNDRQAAFENSARQSFQEMQQLQDGIVRNQSEYVGKTEFDERLRQYNLDIDAIKEDLKKVNGKISGVSTFLSKSHGYKESGQASDSTKPRTALIDPDRETILAKDPTIKEPDCSACDQYEYLKNAQIKNLFEKFSDLMVPFGSVTFKAWLEKPWDTEVYDREYKVYTVLAEDREGKHTVYNKFAVSVQGQEYIIPIERAAFTEQIPEPEFEWWNPKIGLAFHAGLGIMTHAPNPDTDEFWVFPSLSPAFVFSPFSYGKSRATPDLLALQVGVGYDLYANTARFSIAPVMWNVGNLTTIINNTYIGPNFGVDTDANLSVGAGVAVSF